VRNVPDVHIHGVMSPEQHSSLGKSEHFGFVNDIAFPLIFTTGTCFLLL